MHSCSVQVFSRVHSWRRISRSISSVAQSQAAYFDSQRRLLDAPVSLCLKLLTHLKHLKFCFIVLYYFSWGTLGTWKHIGQGSSIGVWNQFRPLQTIDFPRILNSQENSDSNTVRVSAGRIGERQWRNFCMGVVSKWNNDHPEPHSPRQPEAASLLLCWSSRTRW